MSETPQSAHANVAAAHAHIHHIHTTYHPYYKEELPFLHQIVQKIAKVHGPNDGEELYELEKLYEELQAELEDVVRQEAVLLPRIKAYLEDSEYTLAALQDGTANVRTKHEKLRKLLQQMRTLTADYTLPPHACRTYTMTFTKLQQLESQLSDHIERASNGVFSTIVS